MIAKNEYNEISRKDLETVMDETPGLLHLSRILSVMPLISTPAILFYLNYNLSQTSSLEAISIPYSDQILVGILIFCYFGYGLMSEYLLKSDNIRQRMLKYVSSINDEADANPVIRVIVADRMYMMLFLAPLFFASMFCGILLMLQRLLFVKFYLAVFFIRPLAIQGYITFTNFVSRNQFAERIEKQILSPLQAKEDSHQQIEDKIIDEEEQSDNVNKQHFDMKDETHTTDEAHTTDNDDGEFSSKPLIQKKSSPEDHYSLGRKFLTFYLKNWLFYFSALLVVYAPLIALKIGLVIMAVLDSTSLEAFQSFYSFIYLPLSLFAMFMGSAVVSQMVCGQLVKIKVDIWESLANAFTHIWSLVSSALIVVFFLACGAFLCSSIGNFSYYIFLSLFFTLFSFTPIVCVIENKSGFSAPFRSASLVLSSISIFFRSWLLLCAGTGIIYIMVSSGGMVQWMLEAALFSWPAFIYFDLRKTHENFSYEKYLKESIEG